MTVFDERSKELLSGFLDGELTIQEKAFVEQLLQNSEEARIEHRHLLSMRQLLQSEEAHRLPSDFSKRVMEAALLRAANPSGKTPLLDSVSLSTASLNTAPLNTAPMGTTVPVVRLNQSQGNASERERASSVGRKGLWSALAALAASLMLIAYVASNQKDWIGSGPKGINGFVSNVESAGSGPISEKESLAEKEVKSVEVTPSVTEPTNSASIAKSQTPEVVPAGDDPVGVQPKEVGSRVGDIDVRDIASSESASSPSSLIANDAVANSDRSQSDAGLGSMVGSQISKEEAEQLAQFNSLLNGKIFMSVVDFTITEQAWEDQELMAILNQNDIAYSSPASIDDKTLTDLKASRVIGPLNGVGEPDVNKVALIFIKARASRVDRVIQSIAQRLQDFPEFSMDMAVDLPIDHGLTQIREFGALPANKSGLAKALQPEGLSENGLSVFASAPRRTPVLELDVRKKWQSPPEFDESMNPVVYSLLLIRR